MKRSLVIFSLLVLTGFNSIKAQQPVVVTNYKPGWHKIAEKSVGFNVDKDEIVILGADKFKAIQLKVTDAHIHMEDMDVFYQVPGINEDPKEDIQIRKDLKTGERTRIVYLQYPCLKLKKITFVYRTVPNRRYEKAHIEIYALK
jgi:hypothetical protein